MLLHRLCLLLSILSFGFSGNAFADNSFKLGVEGFYENYREPGTGIDVNEHANWGSVTGEYMHSYNNYFSGIQLRGSYGDDHYKSVSGSASGIPQYETEARLLTGMIIPTQGGNNVIIPYIGLGSRFFYDNSKGVITNLGFFGYDRRILQFYLPIGATWKFTRGNWTYAPNLEVDPLLLGKVNSRLQNGGTGDFNLTNTQHDGFGLRGEFMVGQQGKKYGWEVGPFIRYWNIRESKGTIDPLDGSTAVEPNNTRIQAGAALRVTF